MAMSCKLLAVAAMLALAGCQSTPYARPALPQAGSLDAGFGETTKYNAAVQIINPDPVYTADGAQPGDSGAKAAAATRRYRTDAVKATQAISSTTSGGGGSQ
jgi:hypothetical protein